MDKIDILILDFDGVILESVGIKTQAFRELFSGYPDEVEGIIDFHLKNDGLSRYKKFDHIYANILKLPLDEGTSRQLGRRFSEIALAQIKQCPFVLGALELVRKYSRIMPVFIASGTPEPELRDIVRVRGIDRFFSGVYGTPAAKSDISRRILAAEALAPKAALFVGDTMTDYTEAEKVGIPFVGRWDGKLPRENPFLGLEVPVVSDLRELDIILTPTLPGRATKKVT